MQKSKVVVICPNCYSDNISNRFEGYNKKVQTHVGFRCEDCNDDFTREDAIFKEKI